MTVTVSDIAGNNTSTTSTFTVDTVAPLVSVVSPADTAQLSNGSPTLDYTVDDSAATVAVTLNGQQVNVANGQRLAPKTNPFANSGSIPRMRSWSPPPIKPATSAGTASFTVDAAAGPPASFTYAPGSDYGVHEGDAVGLYADDTGNPGGSQANRTWQWSVGVGDNDPSPASYTGPVGFVVPGGSGTWTVEHVTDTVTGRCNSTQQQSVQPQAPARRL